jgi:predicted outer membrane repeat protein
MHLHRFMQLIATSGLAVSVTGASCFGATVLYVDDDAPPGGDGQSWQTAFTYLQDALYAARTPGSAGAGAPGHGVPGAEIDEIHVAQGRYQPDQDEAGNVTPGDREETFALISGVSLKGGYAGLGAPDPDGRDIELYETIFTGDLAGDDQPDFVNYGENSYHVVSALDCDSTAILDGFTITAGNADGANPHNRGAGLTMVYPAAATVRGCSFIVNTAASAGGGLVDGGGNTAVSDCAFTRNRADYGAGIAFESYDSTITHCAFTDNVAAVSGGGLYLGGWYMSVTDSTFLNNSAPEGGGMTLGPFEDAIVSDCIFIANSAVDGGGAYSHEENTRATISGCIFSANIAEDNGGGFYCDGNEPLVVNCQFIENTAGGEGGGLAISFYCDAEVRDCICSGNSAAEGGGIYHGSDLSTLINTTCSGNSAVRGGGVHALFGANLHQCTMENNEAIYGGGLYLLGYADLTDLVDCVIICNAADSDGGGVYVDLNDPNFTRCTFADNVSGANGGAVYLFAGDPTITDCTFTQNVTEFGGGGIYGAVDRGTLTGCAFEGNAAEEGGGLHTMGGAPTLTDCTFSANSAASGGGVYGLRAASVLYDCSFLKNEAASAGGLYDRDGAPALHNCTFDGNSADTGGGCSTWSGSTPVLIGCTFTKNTATTGGGLRESHSASLVIDCVFTANDSGMGGAVDSYQADGTMFINCMVKDNSATCGGGLSAGFGDPTLVNCALIDNIASVCGGAAYHDSYDDTTYLNCTLAGNAAQDDGDAMYIDEPGPALGNCILWSNGDDPIDGTASITFSCIEGGYEGEGNISGDPLFVDPGNDDYHLSPGSPCIDGADNDAVPDDITTDLDGNPRFVDDPDTEDTGHGEPPIVDMGAYEYQLDTCPADFDNDGDVDAADLLHLLAAWGTPDGDVDGDDDTDTADLLALLAAWGQCP